MGHLSSPVPKEGTRASSPWMNHRGFRAREWVNHGEVGSIRKGVDVALVELACLPLLIFAFQAVKDT